MGKLEVYDAGFEICDMGLWFGIQDADSDSEARFPVFVLLRLHL